MQTQYGESPAVRIGLEVHCQLTALATKLFCSCSSNYRDKEPNTLICPVCAGLPGTLPVVNRRAVEFAVMIGSALNCRVSQETLFFRKNYYYPDLPKNFQISQYDKAGGIPIARDGYLGIERKKVRIRRIQLEEDPGRLTYEGTIERSSYSLVDYNRAGIALVEIVTEPDLEDAKEAKVFLERLRTTIESIGASDGELEGAMRCDANISLAGGARVEIKNISSFKEVAKALNYEILRQRTFATQGKSETRHWDERRSITIALRSKEEEQDYRYFPEPDLPPIRLTEEDFHRIRAKMPEPQELKAKRFTMEYKVPLQTANELVKSRRLADFFESCAKTHRDRTELANWLVRDIRKYMEEKEEGGRIPISPERFVEFLELVDKGKITKTQARQVLQQMVKTGSPASSIVATKSLAALRDESSIEKVVETVISARPELLARARGDRKAFNYLVGQVLREEPKAEPKLVAKIIASKMK